MLLATLVLVHYYQPSEESIVNQVEKENLRTVEPAAGRSQ